MKHEKIFFHPAHKVKITAILQIDHTGVYWNKMIEVLPEGKRKWLQGKWEDVSPAEVWQTKLELWEKLKPTLTS